MYPDNPVTEFVKKTLYQMIIMNKKLARIKKIKKIEL